VTDGRAVDEPALQRAVLAAAAVAFGDVPGVDVVDEGDLVRSFAPGRPVAYANAIARLSVDTAGFAARVDAIEAAYRAAGLPTSWWIDGMTRPADAAERLAACGLADGGSEAVMVLEPIDAPGSRALAEETATRAGATVRVVERRGDLDDWIVVMAGAYGWSDAARAQVMRGLYDPEAPHGRNGRRIQVLARVEGRAVGAASLFLAAGQAWVTNVGTIPAARGRGVGAAVTTAVLALGGDAGCPTAWLAASGMGEPVYRRLGFRTVGRLAHRMGPAPRP
jgi:GNAT superfamily N-acetyltransferase